MSLIISGPAEPSPTRPWPADRVEHWPIETLIPYANNPRLHNDADLERVAASIVKWGWTNPALVVGCSHRARCATHLVRALSAFTAKAAPESGDKLTRFGPFSSQCRADNVKMRRGSWNEELF